MPRTLRTTAIATIGILVLGFSGCGVSPSDESGMGGDSSLLDGPTYYGSAKAILETNCVDCHREGDIGPFPLDSYDQAYAARAAIAASVANGTMPPWPPDPNCNDYSNDRSIPTADKEVLMAWSEGAAQEGDPSEYLAPQDANEALSAPEDFDINLELPEPFTPTESPDEYRCVLIDWPEEETSYVTAFRVFPDRNEIVHHVIAFVSTAEGAATYRSLDDQHEGQGYPCFGGPGGNGNSGFGTQVSWLASWAPGGGTRVLPEETGIRVEPGAVIILQMHYNTLSTEPVADQSAIALNVTDEVERPGTVIPFTNYRWIFGSQSMSIPAGESSVSHSTRMDLSAQALDFLGGPANLSNGDSFRLYSVGHHMHLLGTYGRSSLHRSDGSEQCMLEINDWDFNWQTAYELTEPLEVHPGDEIELACNWDNSAGNQAVIDGEPLEPVDLEWGDGTRDEMCLGIYYITGL